MAYLAVGEGVKRPLPVGMKSLSIRTGSAVALLA